jgi:hypothetical protein
MNVQDYANQILDAAMHRQWALLAALLLVGSVAALRWITPKLHDKFGAFLNTQRGGALLALVGGAAGALSTSLIAGQALNAQLLVAGFGTGLMAIGGWNAFFDIFFPKDGKSVVAMFKRPSKPDNAGPIDVAPKLLPFLFIALAFTYSGCGYCWQTQHEQEPKCVIAHDVVQCAEGDALDAVAIAGAILGPLVSGGTIPSSVWDAIKAMAIKLGFKTGGCFWAKLQEYFNTPSASMMETARVAAVKSCQNAFDEFKQHYGTAGVKFCFAKDGKQVCR